MKKVLPFLFGLVFFLSVPTVINRSFAYSFTDTFTAPDNTPLSTYNSNYSQIAGPSTPYIKSDQVTEDFEYWEDTYPVNLETVKVCVDSTNALDPLGFQTALGTVSGVVSASSGSSHANLYIGSNTYTSANVYNNSGTHTYCVSYDGSTISLLRDNVSVVSHSLTSIGTITSVEFGAHNYTSYGWTNPVATVDNLSIEDLASPTPTPTPTAYSFTDTFTAPDNTPLSTYNSNYSQIAGPSTPYIKSDQVTEDFEYWEDTYPVNLETVKVCVDSTNALDPLGFQTAIGSVYGYISSSTGSSHANLTIGSEGNFTSTATYDNSGTHTYCLSYDGSTVSLLRDNVSVVSHSLTSIGTITSVEFGAHNYTSYGWTNPVATVDNLSIEGLSFTPPNTPPVINSFSGATINEGDTYAASGSFTDSDSTSWTATVDYGDGGGAQSLSLSGTNFSLNHVYQDNGTYTVTVRVTDNQGATGTGTATVTVNNVAPTPGAITAPSSPVLVNTAITASANFTDPGVLDTHSASWNWGDGNNTTGTVTESNGSGSVSNSHTYTATGVYMITLTVTDKDGGVGTSTFQYVSVYDSNSSFAGGRSFDNPSSASPSTTGKVSFGISAKYNNSNVLTGNAKMDFKAASLDFVSTSLQSLATSNGKAYLKGTGTLNGSGTYTFLASGIDGSVAGGNDLIRFQIKDSSNNVVYDSQPGAGDTADPTTTDATGNIRVH